MCCCLTNRVDCAVILLFCDKTSSKSRGAWIIILEWFSGSFSAPPPQLQDRTVRLGETSDVNLAALLEEDRQVFWHHGTIQSLLAKDQWLRTRQTDRELPHSILCVCVLLGATEWYNTCKMSMNYSFLAASIGKIKRKLQFTCQNKCGSIANIWLDFCVCLCSKFVHKSVCRHEFMNSLIVYTCVCMHANCISLPRECVFDIKRERQQLFFSLH